VINKGVGTREDSFISYRIEKKKYNIDKILGVEKLIFRR
jgi:hypothetical protein